MASKSKEVYKTIKRSISSTTSGLVSNGNALFGNATTSKSSLVGQKSKWIHPPELLLNHRVEYPARLLGQTEVSSPKGTHVVRDAIHTIKFQTEVNKGITGHSGSKLKKVDIIINVDGIIVQDSKTHIVITNQPLHNVSFVADDKQDKRLFSFIAKTGDNNKHECFVFISDKLAEQITLTIGEAFDLAYQKFVDRTGKDLEFQKQIIILRKKVAILEEENKALKMDLCYLRNNQDAIKSMDQVANSTKHDYFINQIKSNNENKLVPLPPPPSTAKRNIASTAPITNEDFLLSTNPDVGTKLENLRIDKMEDIFDNDFNPRAEESSPIKDTFGLMPFNDIKDDEQTNATASLNSEFTVKEFEDMIMQVDKRIAELHNKFNNGKLDTGDTGESGRDLVSGDLHT